VTIYIVHQEVVAVECYSLTDAHIKAATAECTEPILLCGIASCHRAHYRHFRTVFQGQRASNSRVFQDSSNAFSMILQVQYLHTYQFCNIVSNYPTTQMLLVAPKLPEN